jgi:hypothetical protein
MLERWRSSLPPGAVLGSVASQGFRLLLLLWAGRYVSIRLGADGILALGVLQNLLVLGIALPAQALQMPIQQAVAADPGQADARGAEGLALGQFLAILSGIVLAALVVSKRIWVPAGLPTIAWVLPFGICCTAAASNLQSWTIGRGGLARTNLLAALLSPLQALWLVAWIASGRGGLVPGALLFGAVALPATVLGLGKPRWGAFGGLRSRMGMWWPLLAMASITTLLGPTAQMVLRELVVKRGLEVAATWQSGVRLSDILFGTWSMAFSAWALPRLARKESDARGAWYSAGGALVLAGFVAVSAPLLLSIAYAHRFQDATDVLRVQALAEVARAVGLPWTLRLMVRRSVWTYAAIEVGGTLLQIGLAALLVSRMGAVGAPCAVLLEAGATALVTRLAVLRLERPRPVQTLPLGP